MAVTMQQAMARSATRARLSIQLTNIPDTTHGDPWFHGSDSHFLYGFAHGGEPISPVVLDWGVLERNMDHQSASVMLAADAWWVPTTSTTRKRVSEWFRILNVLGQVAVIYQWNEEVATPAIIWTGYIREVTWGKSVNGVAAVELVLSGESRTMEQIPASDLINETDFSQAPKQSVGFMVPLAYGQVPNRLSSGMVRNSVGMVGSPMMGSKGIVVDDEDANNKVVVRFNKHDGTSPGNDFSEGTFDAPVTTDHDLWCWDDAIGAYGLIDNFSMTFVNDTAKLDVSVTRSKYTHFFIPLAISGSETAAGFTDLSKLSNENPNDYLESTSTDFKWAFESPDVPVKGQVVKARVLVDWLNGHASKDRRIRFGLWDVFKDGGAGYLDGIATTHLRDPGLERTLVVGDIYDAWNFRSTSAARFGTQDAFRSGRLITRGDADGEEANLQLKVEVDELGGLESGQDGVRIYHIMLVLTVWFPELKTWNAEAWLRKWRLFYQRDQSKKGRDLFIENQLRLQRQFELDRRRQELGIGADLRGTDYFVTGGYQEDDGSGTYTETAGGVISRPCDIAHHLLHKRWGRVRNVTTGTVGNFDEARDGILNEMTAFQSFGPDRISRRDAIDEMKSQWPMFIAPNKAGSYCCHPDDMNPHSSAYYRSSANIVKITKDDIVDGSFGYDTIQVGDIVNSVELRYAHGYPNREHARTTTYENKLSQKYFTKLAADPFDAPFLTHSTYDTGVLNGATAYAQWLGRRTAMPLILPRFRTVPKFYDLDLGHIFFLDDNVGDILPCQKFRGGLLYYYFESTSGTTDRSNSSSFSSIQTGVASKIHIGLPQQVDHLIFSVSVAAVYTSASDAWKYSSGVSSSTAFGDANTTNKDALKSTGTQTVRFIKPAPHLWTKQERTFGAFGVAGPCYWVEMDYSGGTTAGTQNARGSYTPGWDGIPFRVFRSSRHAMGEGGYVGCAIGAREVY